jgi:hypothetical protein
VHLITIVTVSTINVLTILLVFLFMLFLVILLIFCLCFISLKMLVCSFHFLHRYVYLRTYALRAAPHTDKSTTHI